MPPKLERTDSTNSLNAGPKNRLLSRFLSNSDTTSTQNSSGPSKLNKLRRTDSSSSVISADDKSGTKNIENGTIGLSGPQAKFNFAFIAKRALEKKKTNER